MNYRILYYNSIDRSWRDGLTMSMDEAAEYAQRYFQDIVRDGIFGEADKLYIGADQGNGVDVWPSHVWNKKTESWKELA